MSLKIFVLSFTIVCLLFSCQSNPQAKFNGLKKGRIDKFAFISSTQIELTNNKDSVWAIKSYEFNYSCGGEIIIKQFNGSKISKEIFDLVKNCKTDAISDFRQIMLVNRKSGKVIQANNIMLTVY